MQKEHICGTCRYFDPEFIHRRPDEPERWRALLGVCRRHPPVPSAAQMLRRAITGVGSEAAIPAVYPEIRHTDWCGDWATSVAR